MVIYTCYKYKRDYSVIIPSDPQISNRMLLS